MSEKIAILVDGGFAKYVLWRKMHAAPDAEDIVELCRVLLRHPKVSAYSLYRIYYYDAPPFEETRTHPVTKQQIQFKNSEVAKRGRRLLQQIELKEDVALRKGTVLFQGWTIKEEAVDHLAATGQIRPDDIKPNIEQKGVDMRIGLDIAWMSLKQLVQAILLVTGDSDFVPAMKFARREGVRVFLYAFDHRIKSELRAHSDVVILDSDIGNPPPT